MPKITNTKPSAQSVPVSKTKPSPSIEGKSTAKGSSKDGFRADGTSRLDNHAPLAESGQAHKELKALLQRAGSRAAGAELAESGDVDFPVPSLAGAAGGEFAAPLAKLGSKWASLSEGARGLAGSFVAAHGLSIRSNQDEAFKRAGLRGKKLADARRDADELIKGVRQTLIHQAGLQGMTKNLTPPNTESLQGQLEATFQDGEWPMDPVAYVQWVLREAYMDTTQSMYHYGAKVEFFTELKRKYRDEIARAREKMKELAGRPEGFVLDDPFTPEHIDASFTGTQSADAADPQAMDPAVLAEWEAKKALYDELYEEWANPPNNANAPGPNLDRVRADVPSSRVKGSTGVKKFIEHGTVKAMDTLAEWWDALSPHEQQQFATHFKENGITLTATTRETSQQDDQRSATDTVRLTSGDPNDVMEFFEEHITRVLQTSAERTNDADSGKMKPDWAEVAWDIPEQLSYANQLPLEDITGTLNGEQVNLADLQVELSGLDSPYYGQVNVAQNAGAMGPIDTKDELDEYIQEMEGKLNTAGDDAQLSQLDLQNWLQKQQQLLQLMSNIAKTTSDTIKAMIRNIA